MTIDTVRSVVINVLECILRAGGHPPLEVTDDTRPLMDLDGFDSLNALEFDVMVEDALGLPSHAAPFAVLELGASATVRQVVRALCDKLSVNDR